MSTNRYYLVIIICIYGFVLENFVETNILKQFGYFDEIIALYFGIVFILNVSKILSNKYNKKIILCTCIILCMAVISTIICSFQPVSNAVLDLYANLKFVFVFLGAGFYYRNFDLSRYAEKIFRHVRFITILLGSLTILDIIFDIFPANLNFNKWGHEALSLFYGHPATLGVVCVLLYSVLLVLSTYGIKSRIYQIALFVIMLMTLRAKTIGAVAIFFALYLYCYYFNKKITMKRIILLMPLAVILGWSEIQSYYVLNQEASRLMLTVKSIQIGKDYFPFGTGLATFGSAFSVHPYSPVYSMYSISNIWGLSEQFSQDISDTFWPMIIGQFGAVAFIAYILVVYYLYKKISSIGLKYKYLYLGSWFLFIYLMLASTSESSFVNAYAVFYGFFISLFIAQASLQNSKKRGI